MSMKTDLELNLRLSNVLFTTATAGDLVGLRDLVPHVLRAEVFECVALNCVDAELGARLHCCEATRHCARFLVR